MVVFLQVTVECGMQRHATVMGSTWGLLIPAAILMARLRNKKGWWFQLHRALAIASLFLVVVGTILGRRLRVSHPPVTTAGKLHKFFGYTAVTCICVQVWRSALCRCCPCTLPHLLHICCMSKSYPHAAISPMHPSKPIYHHPQMCRLLKLSDNSFRMCLHVMLLGCALVVVPCPCYACLSMVFLFGCAMHYQNVIGLQVYMTTGGCICLLSLAMHDLPAADMYQ